MKTTSHIAIVLTALLALLPGSLIGAVVDAYDPNGVCCGTFYRAF